MAVDKLVDSAQLDSGLTQIATAIRNKGQTTSGLLFPSGFVSAINNISTMSGSISVYDIAIPQKTNNKYMDINRALKGTNILGWILIPSHSYSDNYVVDTMWCVDPNSNSPIIWANVYNEFKTILATLSATAISLSGSYHFPVPALNFKYIVFYA